MKNRANSTGSVDSRNIFCSWSAQAHVSIHSCDFTPKDKKSIESCCIVFRKELQVEQFGLKSGTLCCKNSWLPKKNTKQRTTLNEYNRLPTTRDTVRHEKLLRVRYINRDLPRCFSLGLQDKYVLTLTSRTILRKVQSSVKNACVRDSRECNYIVESAACASTRGIHFIPDSSRDNAIVVRFSDASFCQEQEQLDGVTQNSKSQQAGITALAPCDALNAVRMLIHPPSWSLTGIRRVCYGSLMVDAYILSNFVEQGLRTGAVVLDMRGQLNVHQTIDLSALKQIIWDNHDDCDEEVDGTKSCYCLRGDTSATLPDCFSMTMTSCRLDNTSSTGIFDTRPTEKSPAIKEKNRKWRALREGAGTVAGF